MLPSSPDSTPLLSQPVPNRRRYGLLPTLLLACVVYGLVVCPDFRHAIWAVITEIALLVFCGPPLLGACFLAGTYVVTLYVQPNTGFDWHTGAWLQALCAAVLTLLASPLLSQLAHVTRLDEASLQINMSLPIPLAQFDNGTQHPIECDEAVDHFWGWSCFLACLHIDMAPWILVHTVTYKWWLLAALFSGVSTCIFALHTVIFGCLWSAPAMWRYTKAIDDDVTMAALRDFVGNQCATQKDKYKFGMTLCDAWAVCNDTLENTFDQTAAKFQQAGKPSNVLRLFHGTHRDSARAIIRGGFRLPPHAGMYGKGIYFADCPLKSLQYTGWAVSKRRYMLVCDVQLGNTLVQTGVARPEIDPRGGTPIEPIRRSFGFLNFRFTTQQMSFDSVSAMPSWLGVRVPEYIVYDPVQCVPKYLLAVKQVDASSMDALGERAGMTWLSQQKTERAQKDEQRRQKERDAQMKERKQQQQKRLPSYTISTAVEESLLQGQEMPMEVHLPGTLWFGQVWEQFQVKFDAERAALVFRAASALPSQSHPSCSQAAVTSVAVAPFVCALPLEHLTNVAALPTNDAGQWQFTFVERRGTERKWILRLLPQSSPAEHTTFSNDIACASVSAQRDRLVAFLCAILARLSTASTCGAHIYDGLMENGACTRRAEGDEACSLGAVAMEGLPAHLSNRDLDISGKWWKDEERYLSRPKLNDAQQRALLGLPQSWRFAAYEGAMKMRAAICAGPCLEILLKIACCPIVVPVVIVAMLVQYVFFLLMEVPGCLWCVVNFVCEAFVLMCKFGTAAIRAIRTCWYVVLNFLGRRCKIALFAIYDCFVLPLGTVVHKCFIYPICAASRCFALATWNHLLAPCGHVITKFFDNCAPVTARCCKGLVTKVSRVVFEVDVVLTGAVVGGTICVCRRVMAAWGGIRTAALWIWREGGLQHVVIAASQSIQNCAHAIGQAVWRIGEWIGVKILMPLRQLVEDAANALCHGLKYIFRVFGRAAFWAWATVMVPIANKLIDVVIATRRTLAVAHGWLSAHVLTPLCKVIRRSVTAVYSLIWSGLGAASSVVRKCTRALRYCMKLMYASILAPLCAALRAAFGAMASEISRMIAAFVALVWSVVSPIVATAAALAVSLVRGSVAAAREIFKVLSAMKAALLGCIAVRRRQH